MREFCMKLNQAQLKSLEDQVKLIGDFIEDHMQITEDVEKLLLEHNED